MIFIKTNEAANAGFNRPYAHSLSLPKGKHIGLIAQEVEEVLPNLITPLEQYIYDKVPQPKLLTKPGDTVTEEDYGKETIKIKAINYTELVPVLVRGMQELDSSNKAKDEKIAMLEEKLNEALELLGREGLNAGSPWIKQNSPNQVSSTTVIQYSIPFDAGAARILITNAKGQQLKVYNVAGKGTITFGAGTLPSGTYTYSLVVDGKTISSKKMVIAR